MDKYGFIFDQSYNLEKDYIYKIICEYFDYPDLQKVKDDSQFSTYLCKASGSLINQQRYIIAITEKDNFSIGTRFNLKDLSWISFQTRTLSTKYEKVPTHFYTQKKKEPYTFPIQGYKRDMKITNYECPKINGLYINLIHTKPNDLWEYPPQGTVGSALETYQTVLSFSKD